ncbi:MAG TPA: NADPH-dependent F420 reductase [Methanotrichaceae archaeon]|nr:NADPH-dependent F420 reductase [Methanotrichaceae archaeon]HQF16756.1 NADPH-dependent F420 reductase [Methanotrichaceae archaeon]HQI91388.1 NADPH-dependent F420 reductase [Methanotrichaceae archaeon]HQJ28646.1 NADPH-dependent F420 reductase [Methanotrichaceae archaeon]
MKIALVGGTGDIGMGFALRWAANHEIVIGSRKADKAIESAYAVKQILDHEGDVWGADNSSAVSEADAIVLCVPHEHLSSVAADLTGCIKGCVVISPIVPMSYNGKFFRYCPPSEGSAALQAKSLLPADARIVSAFHTISASALAAREVELRADTFLCGDDQQALELVRGLALEMRSIRPLMVGPLEASSLIESLTPMLLNAARKNKIKDAGISVVSEGKAAQIGDIKAPCG